MIKSIQARLKEHRKIIHKP